MGVQQASVIQTDVIQNDMMMDEDDNDVNNINNNNTNNNNGIIKPNFEKLSAQEMAGGNVEYRKIRVSPHRYTPLREQWDTIMQPLVEYMKLQVRFNPKNRCVELKTSEFTEDGGSIQKGADFVQAFMMGFGSTRCCCNITIR